MERKMKDSGIEWIGKIPEEWNTIKIKYTSWLKGRIGWQGLKSNEYQDVGAYLITGTDFSKGIISWDSCVRISEERFNEAPEIHIKEGDLLITKDGTIGKVAIAKDCPQKVSLNSGVLLIRNTKNFKYYDKYLYYVLLSDEFWIWYEMSQTGNSTIRHLYQEQFYNFEFTFPTMDEQKKIANYLDEKVGEIDAIILKTKESIEEYKKYRKAIVIKAVTKGLNSNVTMKKTDSDWIGEIPAHWNYVRIQSLFETVDERNEDENAILLSLYTALGVKPRNELEEKGNKASTVVNYKKVKKNDVIVNKLLAWMGAIGYSDYEGVTSPDYDVYRAREGANVVRNYYNEYFRNTCFNGDCYKYGHGIMLMRWRTYPEEFLRIKVPNPPLEEQQEIADYLNQKCTEIDTLIAKKEAFVLEMESYKKSLIYEYVTGKKEVL